MLAPENQAVAHRLGLFWFRPSQVSVLGKNEEDEVLVDSFVFGWSYLQACGLVMAAVVVVMTVAAWVCLLGGEGLPM